MPEFGEKSKAKLDTCDILLNQLFYRVVAEIDCTVICGARNKLKQDDAFRFGYSKSKWPESKHNINPGAGRLVSKAVDVIPWHAIEVPRVDWSYDNELYDIKSDHKKVLRNIKRWHEFIGVVKGIASMMDIKIRCGADFENFVDMAHFELI